MTRGRWSDDLGLLWTAESKSIYDEFMRKRLFRREALRIMTPYEISDTTLLEGENRE